jgi:hypothetical protein
MDLRPPPWSADALCKEYAQISSSTRSAASLPRRSIAMLQPGALAMTREDASQLLCELGEVQGRLDRLRDGLRTVFREEGGEEH